MTSISTDDDLLTSLSSTFQTHLTTALQSFRHQNPKLTSQFVLQAGHMAIVNLITSEFKNQNSESLERSLDCHHELLKSSKSIPTRGYIDGCFDIMHSGHYNAIRQAKAIVDELVVGVHSDAEILKHKGPPVMNENERLATVKACKWVDEVVFDTPYDPSLKLLDELNCDFCIHGDDATLTADGRDAYEEVKAAKRMKIVKRTEGISTTDLVGRLLLLTKDHHIREPVSPSTPPKLQTSSPISLARNLVEKPVYSNDLPKETPHYARAISNFLPTTWRIAQFSNNKTPKPEDKVVYIDGAFDLFHIGHIETLRKASKLGTFLYVGIHDDQTVNAHKGRNYPIMNLHERVLNVLSCKYVDEVVIGAPWNVTNDLVKTLGIHIVCSGSNTKMDLNQLKTDSTPEEDPYSQIKELNMFKEIETSHSLCTEDVVTRIIENRLKYENRNAKRSIKELNYLTQQKQYVQEL